MDRLGLLLWITFIESLATVFVERGIYFFSRGRLGFSDAENLWLALAFGAAYVVGALLSHPVSQRVKEKPLLVLTISGQLLAHVGLAWCPLAPVVFIGSTALGWLNGLKWPLLESYVSAGRTPVATAGAIGRFNVSWAAAVPTALVLAGPLIDAWPMGLFLAPAALNALSLLLLRPLTVRPLHLPADHPQRPDPDGLRRMRGLLVGSRWLMLFSYGALWVLAALMPRIFESLHHPVKVATALSGVVDLVRLAAFLALGRYVGWHYRTWPLMVSLAVLPAGFLMVLSGVGTAAVLTGEVLFGFAAGMTYYAALYYAMVVKNASVDAGGGHEGLIGLGFAIGPGAGLLGIALAPVLGGKLWGILAAMAPFFALCAVGALLRLTRTPALPPRA